MRKILKRFSILFIMSIVIFSAVPTYASTTKVPLLDGIISVEGNHAIDNKGVLWSWDEKTFEAVPVLENVKKITRSNTAVKKDGTVWRWGNIYNYVTDSNGNIISTQSFSQPAQVKGLDNVVDISGGYALKADGTVWSIGGLCEFQLPNPSCASDASIEDKTKPGRIGELNNIVAIEGYGYFPSALAKDGTFYIWGRDKYSDPFLPSTVIEHKDNSKQDFKGITSISEGIAINASWDVYIMNRYAIYGVSTPSFNIAKLAPNVTAVSGASDGMGDMHALSFILTKDGKVSYWVWPTQDQKVFPVKALDQVKAISANGEGAGSALHKDGTVSSWGRMSNYYGDDKYKYNYKITPKKVTKGIGIRINGNYHFMENQSSFINGSVFVPVRGLFETLGGTVNYANDTVTIKYGSTTVKLEVWKKVASINDKTVALSAPAQIVRGSTMVPLRFVAQALGANVVWDGKKQEVLLTLK